MQKLPHYVEDDLKKYLDQDNGSMANMSTHTEDWFNGQPDLKPSHVKPLYRGLTFNYQGFVDFTKHQPVGSHIKHSCSKLSSWSSLRGVATRYALNSKAVRFYDMKKEFLSRPDKEYGVVIAIVASPKDIVCSVKKVMDKYHLKPKYGNDWEYILRPLLGKQVLIHEVYTKENIISRTSLEGFE